ncbi:MAG: hypothetical protein HDT44_12150 [Ruminococcaceae bacterium]|nr:hypothetical protein [Oscillospiraceae bacterium]
MKLKKVIAAVSAATLLIGCMSNVWAESADVSEEGVSVLPANYEPVTYEMTIDSVSVPLVTNDGLFTEVEIPEETKDISICFDVDNLDYTLSVYCYAYINEWVTMISTDNMEYVIDSNGSYELILPGGLFLEEDSEFEYIESLNRSELFVFTDGVVSNASITITDIKAYKKSHTVEECLDAFLVEAKSDEPDEPFVPEDPEPEDVYGEIDGFEYVIHAEDPDSVIITGYTGKDKDIVVPGEIDGKAVRAIYGRFGSGIITVSIPKTVQDMDYAFNSYYCTDLTAIYVDADNPNYCSVDGILFSKDKTRLVAFPAKKQNTILFPTA